MIKPTKTISGITPVAVMLPPKKCKHGNCTFCPNLDVPQSYTPKSPVDLRARALDYDSFKQVKARLEKFTQMKHPTEKIEIIIMGGTFLEYPLKFQEKYILGIYNALNNSKSRSITAAQKINQSAKHRCIALCIETRPDRITDSDIKKIRSWGATRVELGVQIIDDKIYKKVNRGHTVKDVISATKRLKNAGFKIGYHIMPGLPGSTPTKDITLFKKIFSSPDFKPDQLKLYPCQVMPGSLIEKDYFNKKFKPYTHTQIEKTLTQMIKLTPRYCRIMRVMREIPSEYLTAGTKRIDLRNIIEKKLRKQNTKLQEIRYREIGFALQRNPKLDTNLKLKTTKYPASNGTEYFLEIINNDNILFALLRLRLTKTSAIIRELHVYGKSLKLGQKGKLTQHTGLGKQLISEAEKITRKNKHKKLSIISGVGVREYYKKLGYKLEDTYVIKKL